VGGRVVVMKEPVVVTQEFRSLSSHIFCQASQNVTVKVRDDLGGTNSQGTIPLTSENPMRTLFVELRTCRAFVVLSDCGLFQCDDCCYVSGS
jgi:hypothetical protein